MSWYKLTFLYFMLIVPFLGQTQDIKGKWMQVKIPDFLSYPSVNIIEITNDSIFSYDFDRMIDKGRLAIKEEELILKDTISVQYRFLKDDVFEQRPKNQDVKDSTVFKFVRLLPTKDCHGIADDIQGGIYQIPFTYETMKFKVGEKLANGNAHTIDDPPIATDYVSIELLGNTYFLCFHTLGRINYAFPIKEICPDSLILFGIPRVNEEVVAKRLK